MTRTLLLTWVVVAGTCLATLAIAGRWAASSRRHARVELARYRQVLAGAEGIASLRSTPATWTPRPRSETGLAQRVGESLATCGLPATALAGLTPQGDTPVHGAMGSGSGLARRRISLTLSSVTLPQVGQFLASWRKHEPEWVPVSVDLSPQAGKSSSAGSGAAGGDLPLHAVIAVEGLFLTDDSPTTPSPPTGGAR